MDEACPIYYVRWQKEKPSRFLYFSVVPPGPARQAVPAALLHARSAARRRSIRKREEKTRTARSTCGPRILKTRSWRTSTQRLQMRWTEARSFSYCIVIPDSAFFFFFCRCYTWHSSLQSVLTFPARFDRIHKRIVIAEKEINFFYFPMGFLFLFLSLVPTSSLCRHIYCSVVVAVVYKY